MLHVDFIADMVDISLDIGLVNLVMVELWYWESL